MAVVRQALDHVVVAVLVRDKERASQRAIVRIQAILSKYLLIVIEIVVIYRTIERHYYHLRRLESLKMLRLRRFRTHFVSREINRLSYLLRLKTAGNDRAVSGTEAIRKLTVRRVAALGQIRRRFGDWRWC